jgi:hypothetical protein
MCVLSYATSAWGRQNVSDVTFFMAMGWFLENSLLLISV